MTRNRYIHVYLEEEVIENVTKTEEATKEGTEKAENPDDSGYEEDPYYVAEGDNNESKNSGSGFEDSESDDNIKKGSTTILMLDNGVFMRFYICLIACKQGYKSGCRPILSIDGFHLKGYFGGAFLAAVGIDANDNLYLIDYAVVEAENQSAWY
ncbi:hypothetical protein V6N13_110554 [Hibiscus sabdariffa]